MPKRSRSCSDIRGVSIIKSTRHNPLKRDSSTQFSLLEPECVYVPGSPFEPSSTLDDFDLDDVDVPSYDIERQIKKNETLSKLIHSLILEKQAREKRQSSLEKSQQSSSKFSSDIGASTKKPSTDQLSVSTLKTRLKKDKPIPSNITDDDIEYMREIIRIDKGLPSTKEMKKKSVDVHKMPKILPRPTKLSQSRYQCTRASYPRPRSVSCRDDSSCHEKSIDDFKSPEDRWGEEDLRRLKYLAESHKSSDPSYKYNRVFTLRYQHNKGTPEMPDSFRRSYERYNKPLFRLVKELELPKKYLMPKFAENEVSLFGLVNDDVRFRVDGRKKETEDCIKQRKQIARRGRVLRMINVKPTGPKIPWNYGRVRSCSPLSRY